MSEVASSSPAAERVVRRMVRGHEFAFRRPFRGDVSEISRRYAAKLVVTGLEIESQLLNSMDGEALLWEARFQVCLKTRQAGATVIDLGETAPAHWLRDGSISFEKVDAEEFAEVIEAFAPVFGKPRGPHPPADPQE